MLISYVLIVKCNSNPFSRCKDYLQPMLYPINTLKESNRTKNDQGKHFVVLSVIIL